MHLRQWATDAEARAEDADREADELGSCVEQLKADMAVRRERAMGERIRMQDDEVQEATQRIAQLEQENGELRARLANAKKGA